jgi:hypothetical protein
MKYLLKLVLLCLLISACSENSTEPKDEEVFWSEPTDEAIMLYFREFDSVRLDSLAAGEIQYRLDIAKSVVGDSRLNVHIEWVFGELLLWVNQELYDNFDSTKNRFYYQPLDTLLSLYEIVGVKSRGPRPTGYFFHLLFPEYYNMLHLSKMFANVEGVVAVEQNVRNFPPICATDIKFRKENEIYKFIFRNCYNHFWVIQVVDDTILDITEWDLI